MAYCTQTHIEGEFKSAAFTSTSSVTDTDIARFIAETDAFIDAKVGRKYVVPITGASSLLILRTIAIQINAARARKILEVKSGESDKDQVTNKGELKAALSMLEEIISGKLLLSDSTLAVSHDGVSSYVYSNDITPDFSVTEEQW